MLRDHLDAWLSLLPDGGADVAFEFSLQAVPVRNASGTIGRTVGHATQCLSADTAAGRVLLDESGEVCLQPAGGGAPIVGRAAVRAALDRALGPRLGHGWIVVDADRGGEPEPGNVACAYCGTERSFVEAIAVVDDTAVCADATEAAAAARGLLPRLPGEAWSRPPAPAADGIAEVATAATENAAVMLCRRIANALFMHTSVGELRRRGGADIPASLRDALLAVNGAAVGGSGTYHTPRLVVDLQIDGVPVVRMPLDVEGLPETTRRDLVEGRGGHALSIAIAQPAAMGIPFEGDPARWLLLRHAGLPDDGRRTVANVMIEPDDAWRWGTLAYEQWAVEADADVERLRALLRPSIGSMAAAQLLRHLQQASCVVAVAVASTGRASHRVLVDAPPSAEACVRLLRSMAAGSVWEAAISDDGSAQTTGDSACFAAADVTVIFRSTLRGLPARADRSGVAITVNVENNGAVPEAVAEAVRTMLAGGAVTDPPYDRTASSYSNLMQGRPLSAATLTDAMRRMRNLVGSDAVVLGPSAGEDVELIPTPPSQLRRRDDETAAAFADRVRDRAAELARSALQPFLDDGWSAQALRAAGLQQLISDAATMNAHCRFEDRERGRRLLISFPADTSHDVANRFIDRCRAHLASGVDVEWAWRPARSPEWAIADVRPQGAPLRAASAAAAAAPLPCPRCNPGSLSGVYCARHLTEANVRRLALQEGGRSQPHVWVEQTDGSQRCDDCGRFRSDNVGPDCEARPVLPPSEPGSVDTAPATSNPCGEVVLTAPPSMPGVRMTAGAQVGAVDGQTVGRLTTNDRGQVVGVVVDVAPAGDVRVDLGTRRGMAERSRSRLRDVVTTPPGVTVTQSPGGPVMVRVNPDAMPVMDEVARAINAASTDVVATPAPDGNGVVVQGRSAEGRVAFVSTPYTPQDIVGRHVVDGAAVAQQLVRQIDEVLDRPLDVRDYVLRDRPTHFVVDSDGGVQRADPEPQVVRAHRSEAIVRLGPVDAATAAAMVGTVLRTAGSGPGSDDQIVGVLTEVRSDGTATVRFPIGRAERDAMARPGYRMRGVAAPADGAGDAERARMATLGERIAASLRGPRAVEYGPSGRPRPRNRVGR